MNRFKIFTILWLIPIVLCAAKLGTLSEIYNPIDIGICKGNLYITDKGSVHTFNLNGQKKIRKFVRRGGGPGELMSTPLLRTYDDKLLAFNPMKLAWFTPAGELISEKKLPFVALKIGHVGNHFIFMIHDWKAQSKKYDYMISIGLYNDALKKVSDISTKGNDFNKKSGKKKIRPLVLPVFKFFEYKNKIYLANRRKDFHIDIFDDKGNPSGAIHKEYDCIKISEEYKTRRMEEHKSIPAVKKRWNIMKKTFKYTFPEYFPAIQDFFIADDKLYVKTYLEKDGKEEFWILKLDGGLVKKVFLPRVKRGHWFIYKNQFYYILENEDDEEWELHSVKIQSTGTS